MNLAQKIIGISTLFLLFMSLLMTITGVYIYDGVREKTRYTVPIDGNPNEHLVYYVWDPIKGAPNRENHVVFLFAGFLAQQTMMYPLMREFTKQGYHVVTGDFRGHGESGGTFTMNWSVLLEDFLTIYNDVKSHYLDKGLNFTHVAVAGHSMGGFAALMIGKNCDFVWTTVALAPAPYKGNVNTTRPKNMMIIIGSRDQAFSEQVTLDLFQQAVPHGEPGILYGDPLKGTAKKMVIARWARHENELVDDYCLSQAVSFVEWGFGYMKPGDDFIANQQWRINIIEIGLILGLLGVCTLFFFINNIDLKSIENPKLEKLFERITWLMPGVVNEQRPVDELFETYEVGYTANYSASFLFFKDWFKYYGLGVIIGVIFWALSYLIVHDFFSNLQFFLLGVPGITNFMVARENYMRDRKFYKNFRAYLLPLRHQINRELNWSTILIGIAMYGLTMFIILFGFGQSYMFLFPMNKRAWNLLILIPFILIMYILQAWGYIFHLVARVRNEKNGFWKALGLMLFTKHFDIYVISIVLLILGNDFVTIFAMLTVFDILASTLLLINYWYNHNFGDVLLWATLTLSTIYLGYSGVINGWEIFFGTYNAFYWIG